MTMSSREKFPLLASSSYYNEDVCISKCQISTLLSPAYYNEMFACSILPPIHTFGFVSISRENSPEAPYFLSFWSPIHLKSKVTNILVTFCCRPSTHSVTEAQMFPLCFLKASLASALLIVPEEIHLSYDDDDDYDYEEED